MTVWDSIVGQKPVVDLLRATVRSGRSGSNRTGADRTGSDVPDSPAIAQSWLICGPPGSGRSQVARAFAAALECPRGGCGTCPVCRQIMKDEHPDVTVLATNKITISIDQVRSLIADSEQMPVTAPWRIIIIEDVDRMLERTTNVLLKEIEEPAPKTIWLLCAPSSQDVLPTIRSRTRIVNLAVPQTRDIASFLVSSLEVDQATAARCARLAQGHIGIARLYARDDQALADRDEIVVGVLNLHRTSDAVVLAASMVDNANRQAKAEVDQAVMREQAEFRALNGLAEGEKISPALRSAYHAIGKKDDVRRRTTRLSRDILDRFLTTITSIYRDLTLIHNGAEEVSGLINLENRAAITDLSAAISRQQAIANLASIDTARRRLMHNGSPQLVLEALLSSLIVY